MKSRAARAVNKIVFLVTMVMGLSVVLLLVRAKSIHRVSDSKSISEQDRKGKGMMKMMRRLVGEPSRILHQQDIQEKVRCNTVLDCDMDRGVKTETSNASVLCQNGFCQATSKLRRTEDRPSEPVGFHEEQAQNQTKYPVLSFDEEGQETWFDVKKHFMGTLGALITGSIASGGGLGGGGLLVPLFVIVLGLPTRSAIPLSKASIFGNAISTVLLNIRKKHPFDSSRTLIDFETVCIMEPMTLAGTIFGVLLNTMLPEWLIVISLVVLMTHTSLRTWRKGQTIWAKEAALHELILHSVVRYWKLLLRFKSDPKLEVAYLAARKWKMYRRDKSNVETWQGKHLNPSIDLVTSIKKKHNDQGDGERLLHDQKLRRLPIGSPLSSTSTLSTSSSSVAAAAFRNRIGMPIPWNDLVLLLLAWIGLLVFSLLRGGHGAESIVGVKCPSIWFWTLICMAFPFFAMFTYLFTSRALRRHRILQMNGHMYADGDVRWTQKYAVKYPSICFFAGLAAGLLGIGGGVVKGPLLLEMGLLPQVATATSAAMILFTSSATSIQFVVLGLLPLSLAAWYSVVGFISGILGQFVVDFLIRKYHKTAVVVFILSAVIGVSGLIMGCIGVEDILLHGLGEFQSICG